MPTALAQNRNDCPAHRQTGLQMGPLRSQRNRLKSPIPRQCRQCLKIMAFWPFWNPLHLSGQSLGKGSRHCFTVRETSPENQRQTKMSKGSQRRKLDEFCDSGSLSGFRYLHSSYPTWFRWANECPRGLLVEHFGGLVWFAEVALTFELGNQ